MQNLIFAEALQEFLLPLLQLTFRDPLTVYNFTLALNSQILFQNVERNTSFHSGLLRPLFIPVIHHYAGT